MAQWKKLVLIGIATSVITLAALVLFSNFRGQSAPAKTPQGWNAAAVRATFATVEVRQLNATSAAVVFFYDLENNSGSDYQIEAGPNLRLMSRLKSDGSLVADRRAKLSDNAFLPLANRTRVGVQVDCPFPWPAQRDPTADAKVRALVSQEISNLRGFVLFDSAARYQIELPGGWN
jgi:hypothetical protein